MVAAINDLVGTTDAYEKVVAELEKRKDSTISVPELSELLGVKPTTINARFRRLGTPIITVGRTNYVRGELARPLADLHQYALRGWPTLQEVSRQTGIKTGTLKARCEKGKLEAFIDLTKRLRINPAEVPELSPDDRRGTAPAKSAQPPPPARTKPAKPFSGEPVRRVSTPRPNTDSFDGLAIPRKPFTLPPPPEPRVQIITANDYGIPDHKNGNGAAIAATKTKNGAHIGKKRGALSYDPEKPFSISECSVGKTIKYEHYDGTITKLINDPFNPAIKVALPNHEEPLMREILLRVGK
jgi:hypothetical protein